MTLAEANVIFKTQGADQVKASTDSIGKSLDSVAKKADNATFSIKNIAAGNIIGNILTRIGDKAFELGQNILEMGMNFQTTNAQFEALGMNANKTRDFISDVAGASTLTTKELTNLATSLQLSGFNINRVLPAFARLGDLAGKDQDKLQGMVRLLNVLKTGARPDQELLQSLKLPTLLSDAGLKFNKGKLVGDIGSALEAVIKVIESKTKDVSKAMNKTFEASFSSLVDQFDKIKETLGTKILDWLKPWVDALTTVLKALTASGVWQTYLNQFFNRGQEAGKKVGEGIVDKEVLFKVANFINSILSNIAALPAKLQVVFKYLAPVVKEFFSKLGDDPTIRGFLSIFKKIGEGEIAAGKAQDKNILRTQAIMDLEKKGLITRGESITASAGYPSDDVEKLINMVVRNKERIRSKQAGGGALEGMFGELANIDISTNKSSAKTGLKLRSKILELLGQGNVLDGGKGNITLPGTKLGDDTEVKDDKKKKEKQISLLNLIQDNTKKANELTLREFSYGGGILAQQGVSQVQRTNLSGVSTPQINATDDFSRGMQKAMRGYTTSNNQNLSFRRS